MISLTNFLNKAHLLLFFLALIGCAEIAPKALSKIESGAENRSFTVSATLSSPQIAGSTEVIWNVDVAEVHPGQQFIFEIKDENGNVKQVHKGAVTSWSWKPKTPGTYRVRIRTNADSRADIFPEIGPWSEPFKITAPLIVGTPTPDRPGPQAALTQPVTWEIKSSGGIEPLSHEFELEQKGLKVKLFAANDLGQWIWRPETAGDYRVRVRVTDARGNQAVSEWSSIYKIFPPLRVAKPIPDIKGPQTAATVTIPWSTEGSGGVGVKNYSFAVQSSSGNIEIFPVGEIPRLEWQPVIGGEYRVMAVMADDLGNEQISEWSDIYSIADPLSVESFHPDKPSPQTAQSKEISWKASVTGGVDPKQYDFEVSRDGDDWRKTQVGTEQLWNWRPERQGTYRVRVLITDALGNVVRSVWPEPYVIAPPLTLTTPEPKEQASEYKVDSRISWSVLARGGVGKPKLTYQVENQTGDISNYDSETSEPWVWRPDQTGTYRVRSILTDRIGNQKFSDWSEWKSIKGPLAIKLSKPSLPSPQRAFRREIKWFVDSSGGVGDITFEFLTKKGGVVSLEQRGSASEWTWLPGKAGKYEIKVRAWDRVGQLVETAWSNNYVIQPTISRNSMVAVMPVENLSGAKAPLQMIKNKFSENLSNHIQMLPEERLNSFMYLHRMRHTGYLDSVLSQAFEQETDVDAVLITSLETWVEGPVPKISLLCRLVKTGMYPEILWMDSVGLTGDDHIGLLSIGRVKDVRVLLGQAVGLLTESFQAYLDGNFTSYRKPIEAEGVRLINNGIKSAPGLLKKETSKYLPQFFYRASFFDSEQKYTLAVVPFLNINARKNAETIAALHLLTQLHRYENIRLFEPGLVREILLRYRMIMQQGPSLAAADVLADEKLLGADLVVSGRVFDYQDKYGICKFDFSLLAYDGMRREVVWSSRSYAKGNDGVYFFDYGEVLSAHDLVKLMTRAVIKPFLN